MDSTEFSTLISRLKSGFFASNKFSTINETRGQFTPHQIYLLMGQFSGGKDRTQVLRVLDQNQRIQQMTSKDSEPLVKMGVYANEKKQNKFILSKYVIDGDDFNSGQVGVGADNHHHQIGGGVQHVALPPGVQPGGQPAGSTVTYIQQPRSNQDPISYIAHNAGTSLFGGLFKADIPPTQPRSVTTVTYGAPANNPTPINYPQAVNYPQGSTYHQAPPQHNGYPYDPTMAGGAAMPPPAAASPQGAPPPHSVPPPYNQIYPPLQQPSFTPHNTEYNMAAPTPAFPPQQNIQYPPQYPPPSVKPSAPGTY